MLRATADGFSTIKSSELNKKTFEFYLQKAYERINSIKGITRSKRSIDWIGSAWKWIAGNPDAADWSQVLGSQEKLISNNEHQYVINNKLFETTNEVVKQMNNLINNFTNKISKSELEEITKESLNQLLIIKNDIEEVVRACQLAKSGVINTNLLDMKEIHRIVSEVDSLPYNNEIEAVEYGKPSIFSNGTSLLYVLSIPKVSPKKFEKIITRAAITDGRQLDLRYSAVLLNHEDTFGIKDDCTSMGNITVCSPNQLKKLGEDECLSKILKGMNANCTFLTNKETVVEQLGDDLIFVTNFKGVISSQQNNRSLDGTYLIKLFNETIRVANRKFINERMTNIQALPPLLSNIYEKERKLDLNLLHELQEKNIGHIEHLKYHLNLSIWSQLMGYLLVAIIASIVIVLWKKIFGPSRLPTLNSPINNIKESV